MFGIGARLAIGDVVLIAQCRKRRSIGFTDVVERPTVTVALLIEAARVGIYFGNRTDVRSSDAGRGIVEIFALKSGSPPPIRTSLVVAPSVSVATCVVNAKFGPSTASALRARDDFECTRRHECVVGIVLVEDAAAARVDREKPDVRAAQRLRRAEHVVDVRMQLADLRRRPRKCGEHQRKKRNHTCHPGCPSTSLGVNSVEGPRSTNAVQ